MPAYTNPYFGPSYYPMTSYGTPMYQPIQQQMPVQQSYAPGPACAMAWVDGEIEARGRQMPQGVTQYAMWDTNRQVIYLKSLNQMGMPNPLQVLHYTIEEQQGNLPSGQGGEGGNSGANSPDMSQYVTKQDFEQLRNEIRAMGHGGESRNASGNQNGSNPGQNGVNSGNRGGNR